MSRRATTIWIASAAVVVAAGVGVAATAATHPASRPSATASASARPTASATTSPRPTATPGGVSDGDTGGTGGSGGSKPVASAAPSATSSPSASATSSPATRRTVTPTLGYYDLSGSTLTLGAGVSGLVDSGGTCTVTVRNSSATVVKSFAASPGPSSTDCGAMAITSPKLGAGSWHITIAYSSPRATGTSTDTEVTL